jgi:predicted short-subunit dehydrogenase-like oxidoreductase (DUF2520 family)
MVLQPALRSAGVRVVAAWSRTPRTNQWRTGQLPRGLREAELVILAVADSAVMPLCAQLALERLIGPGQLVVHLAGALDLEPLLAARAAGAKVGSIHPLRAVPPGSRADALAGSWCGIEGSDAIATAQLELLAQTLGMSPIHVAGNRALYHSAAVLAGGGMVALFAEATRAFCAATGATEEAARAALLPLSRGAIETLAARTPGAALTGPLVRGDAGTVATHLKALVGLDWRAASLYEVLSLAGLRLAREAGRINQEAVEALQTALGVGHDEAATPPPGLTKAPEVSFIAGQGIVFGSDAEPANDPGHGHDHDHGHTHGHAHGHAHDHGHAHAAGHGHDHDHDDGEVHTHEQGPLKANAVPPKAAAKKAAPKAKPAAVKAPAAAKATVAKAPAAVKAAAVAKAPAPNKASAKAAAKPAAKASAKKPVGKTKR